MISALIVAAGQGLRMKSAKRKQYLSLCGLPVITHTLRAFDGVAPIDEIWVVLPAGEIEFCEQTILGKAALKKRVHLVAGGPRRQDSVLNGLQHMADKDNGQHIVLIHDGVRPLITPALICECIQGAVRWGACIPAINPVDTLKGVDEQNIITKTYPRQNLRMAQTPQAFRLSLILHAHSEAQRLGLAGTDDASLVEMVGEKVHVISGLRENIKITTKEDLAIARALLEMRKKYL